MARKKKSDVDSDDPRTVALTHEDGRTTMATPEAADALTHYGWEIDGQGDSDVDKAVAPLLERITQLEAQVAGQQETPPPAPVGGLPATANDLIAWIGTDKARAEIAQTAEADHKPTPRTTVTEHIASVLTAQEG